MPQKSIAWTIEIDARIVALRACAASWRAVAAEIGISESSTRTRGKLIGCNSARYRPPPPSGRAAEPPESALPAGHPLTWGAISTTAFPGISL